jgi:hypothetical protein
LISEILELGTSGIQVLSVAAVKCCSITASQMREINSLKLNLPDVRKILETVQDKY